MKMAATGKKKARSGLLAREEREFYLFIAPWLVGFLCLTLGPLIASLVMSFMRWEIIAPPEWIGLGNLRRLFDDKLFMQALKVTTIYTVVDVPLRTVASLLVALALNQRIAGAHWFRTFYYMPSVIPTVAVAMLFLWMLAPSGLINSLLALVQIPPQEWLTSSRWALFSLILMSLWGYGASMVIFLAGLQGIPAQLYEAAEIDGANRWQRLWNVTLPMLSPVILFNVVMAIIGTFQVFTTGFIVTRGGPNNATLFYVLYLYRVAFNYFEMGYASALAWVLFLIILAVTLLTFRSSAAYVYYEGAIRGRQAENP
jgi:multiple sugar transport system permease protein